MTYDQIKPYVEQGLVSEQSHPLDPNVKIFNYTQKCQFANAWNDVTMQCRGLIINVETNEILARPFPKFFNYGEHKEKGLLIPDETPIISEKLDGSLGIMYTLQGKTWIATRGSFVSDQAKWAMQWWKKNNGDKPYGNEITHLFEIIYPENRIVVNYNFSGLVHLTSIVTATGEDLPDKIMPVRKAKRIPTIDLSKLEAMDKPNSEGFVIHYPKSKLRLKIKFAEYVRLHKLVTGVSEIAIWEHMREGKTLDDLLEKVPDEFFKWVLGVQGKIENEFMVIEKEALDHFGRIKEFMDSAFVEGGSRKKWAEQIQQMKNPDIGFSILDKKDYQKIIWKIVRPTGQQQSKTDIKLLKEI